VARVFLIVGFSDRIPSVQLTYLTRSCSWLGTFSFARSPIVVLLWQFSRTLYVSSLYVLVAQGLVRSWTLSVYNEHFWARPVCSIKNRYVVRYPLRTIIRFGTNCFASNWSWCVARYFIRTHCASLLPVSTLLFPNPRTDSKNLYVQFYSKFFNGRNIGILLTNVNSFESFPHIFLMFSRFLRIVYSLLHIDCIVKPSYIFPVKAD
jgi:hypothetical protein